MTDTDTKVLAFPGSDCEIPRQVHVGEGQKYKAVEQIDALLAQLTRQRQLTLYKRGDALVEVGENNGRVVLREVEAPSLRQTIDKAAECVRTGPQGEPVSTDVPNEVVRRLLARLPHSRIPEVSALVTAPTLRADGSLIAGQGWDPKTAIYVAPSVTVPELSSAPDRTDALDALEALRKPLAEVPFQTSADECVILAAALTAVIRPVLPTAPLIGITATAAGTGKGELARYVAAIATGGPPSWLGQGGDTAELEKRMDAMLLHGDPVAVIDNVERPLRSDKLCTLLTERTPRVRVLGQSKLRHLVNSSTLLATGNALTPVGDLVRRSLLCRLDANMEDPHTRTFERTIEQQAHDQRGDLLHAALTILRAYAAAGWPGSRRDMGSFEQWSAWVRSALIWLGLPDPCQTQDALRAADPEREERHTVCAAWYAAFGSAEVEARDLVVQAQATDDDGNLHDALSGVCRSHQPASGPLGRWLRNQEGRVVGLRATETGTEPVTLKLTKRRGRAGRVRWAWRPVGDDGPIGT